MLEICDNPYLLASLRPIYAVCRRFYFNAVHTPDRELGEVYLDMIEAMAARDAERAETASLELLDMVEKIARRQLAGLV